MTSYLWLYLHHNFILKATGILKLRGHFCDQNYRASRTVYLNDLLLVLKRCPYLLLVFKKVSVVDVHRDLERHLSSYCAKPETTYHTSEEATGAAKQK